MPPTQPRPNCKLYSVRPVRTGCLTSSISPCHKYLSGVSPISRGCELFTHHRVNQLHSIVLRGVVTGSHHDTNPLSAKLLRPQTRKQTDSENNSVEEVTARTVVSKSGRQQKADRGMCGGGADISTKLTPSCGTMSGKRYELAGAHSSDPSHSATYPCGAILEDFPSWQLVLLRGLCDCFPNGCRRHCGP